MLHKLRFIYLFVWISSVFLSSPVYAEDLSLDMIFRYFLFSPDKVAGIHSMKDGLHYSVLEDSRYVVRYRYASGEVTDTLFSADWNDEWKLNEVSSYELSEDETKILIGSEAEKIYRYSYQTSYYVYDINSKSLISLWDLKKQQLAKISPDGNYASFIWENNLYIKNLTNGMLQAVTTDGSKNRIINGAPDWVYEEEFALATGYFWSPDSRNIAFYRFDETDVKEYSMVMYDGLYPSLFTYKYPKAGEKNSSVGIYIYSLNDGIARQLDITAETDYYVPFIKWLPGSDKICIAVLNRGQNSIEFNLHDVYNSSKLTFYRQEDSCYISDIEKGMIFFTDSGKSAIVKSDRDGYMHLYLYGMDGSLINRITEGSWEVDEICGVDDESGIIYFTSTEVSPLERHLYSVQIDGSAKKRLSLGKGTFSASFSNNFAYYIQAYSSAEKPHVYTLHNKDGDLIRVLEDNHFIRNLSGHLNFSAKEFFSITTSDYTELNCYRILPPGFKKNKKYPVLFYVYGGPESQSVLDQWETRFAWFQYLARKGYIIVCADNRGTNGRGQDFRKINYKSLGTYEVTDQVALAEYLARQPWVDKKRIGIFGWSYGGYISLLCMMKGNHLFKTGIAVAPVTDWRFYDTIYTERYMGKPEENEKGYSESSPLNYTNQLTGNLLVIHGLADDNVHFQNSAELISKLKNESRDFDMFIYPDENHLMRGENTLVHVYKQITDYIINNL